MEELNIDDLDYLHCPVCDSDGVSYGCMEEIPYAHGKFIQECHCVECNASWQIVGKIEIYSFECIQDGDGNEIAELVD